MSDKSIPAFPRPASDAHQHGMHQPQEGMTLRDYFAAKAMQAIIMSTDDKDDMSAPITESAYKWADAMMEARNV